MYVTHEPDTPPQAAKVGPIGLIEDVADVRDVVVVTKRAGTERRAGDRDPWSARDATDAIRDGLARIRKISDDVVLDDGRELLAGCRFERVDSKRVTGPQRGAAQRA
jgi:hypothetical protein